MRNETTNASSKDASERIAVLDIQRGIAILLISSSTLAIWAIASMSNSVTHACLAGSRRKPMRVGAKGG